MSNKELEEKVEGISKAYVIIGEPLRGKYRVFNQDELLDLIESEKKESYEEGGSKVLSKWEKSQESRGL